MRAPAFRPEFVIVFGLLLLFILFVGVRCLTRDNDGSVSQTPPQSIPENAPGYGSEAPGSAFSADSNLPRFINTPTPNTITQGDGAAPVTNSNPGSHTVQAGDTLISIASQYGLSAESIITVNGLSDPGAISVGQVLTLPSATAANGQLVASSLKLIPDSELIYGPSHKGFSIDAFVPLNSYLRTVTDVVEGQTLNGIEIMELIAERTSVGPRLLLAALEYRSGWVTQSNPTNRGEVMGRAGFPGLYAQLEFAANRINLGYYGRSEGGLTGIVIDSGDFVPFAPEINDGTAGVQNWLGANRGATYQSWVKDVGADGFFATYNSLFGSPFAYSDETFYSANLQQPDLTLPWAQGDTWYFTGGPHGGWISGSGWAALDFVPGGSQTGCYVSDSWVVAMADGVVTRSDFGAVVLDLDGDGYAGTGWTILYQHIDTRDRVAIGTELSQGDRVGHPSCEGGYSTGTHLHVARLYNGRWMSADQPPAFNLDGWVASGTGSEYNGLLRRNGESREAWVGRGDINILTAER